jgi:hypothetical protein
MIIKIIMIIIIIIIIGVTLEKEHCDDHVPKRTEVSSESKVNV